MTRLIWNGFKRFAFVVVVLLVSALPMVLALVPGSSGDKEDELERPHKHEPEVPVEVRTLTPQAIWNIVEANAELRPIATVDLYPDAAGILAEMRVRVGQRVEREEIIATVDASLPGRPYLPSPIRATMSGTVILEPARVGSRVAVHSPVLRIATTNQLELVGSLPERYVPDLLPGSVVSVYFEAYPEHEFVSLVRELSPTIDPLSRSVKLVLSSPTLPEHAVSLGADCSVPVLKAGMFARIRIRTGHSPQALLVPQQAVLRHQDSPAVYVVREPGIAELRTVVLGIEREGFAELVSGVEPGEQVVVRGQNMLRDTTRVRVMGPTN